MTAGGASAWQGVLSYWAAGGLLLFPLAVTSFVIWFLLLRMARALRAAPAENGAAPGQGLEGVLRGRGMIAALTAAAPLIGLLGTVLGMGETFRAVGLRPGGVREAQLAAGISAALITTQLGLLVAIPGLFGLAYLRRLARAQRARTASLRSARVLAQVAGGS